MILAALNLVIALGVHAQCGGAPPPPLSANTPFLSWTRIEDQTLTFTIQALGTEIFVCGQTVRFDWDFGDGTGRRQPRRTRPSTLNRMFAVPASIPAMSPWSLIAAVFAVAITAVVRIVR